MGYPKMRWSFTNRVWNSSEIPAAPLGFTADPGADEHPKIQQFLVKFRNSTRIVSYPSIRVLSGVKSLELYLKMLSRPNTWKGA